MAKILPVWKHARAVLALVLNFLLMVAVAGLVIVVVLGVLTRFLGNQWDWTEELARYLLIWVAMLGGAVAFGAKAHLGVDYFVGKLDPGARKVVAVFGHLVALAFAGLILICGGFRLVFETFAVDRITPALGLKMGYVYLAVPIAGLFVLLFTLENLVESWRARLEGPPEPDSGGEAA